MSIGQSSLQLARCSYCGNYHTSICPRVESMEYHRDGSLKRVVFRPAFDPPKASTVNFTFNSDEAETEVDA